MYVLVVKQLATMLFIMAAGFLFAKLVKVDDKEQKFLSKLLLYLINPLMVFNSFNREFDTNKLKQLAFVTVVSLVIFGIMILIGILTTLSKKKELQDFNQIDRIGVVFTNCGFVGIPLINGVFGSEGVFFLMGYLVCFNVLLWTYGYFQLGGSIKPVKIITNPNIIAVFAGICFYCFQIKLPEFIQNPLTMIGDVNTAVAMILIGILLAGFKKPESKTFIFRIIKFSFVRLILCAFINVLIIFAFYKLCLLIPEAKFFASRDVLKMMLFVILICSMCPAATSIPSLACVFNKDTTYASVIVSITSLLCMVTIPAFVAFAELLIK